MNKYVHVVKAATSSPGHSHDAGRNGAGGKKTSLQHDRQDRGHSRRYRPYPSPSRLGRTVISSGLETSPEATGTTNAGETQTEKDVLAPLLPVSNSPPSSGSFRPNSAYQYSSSKLLQGSASLKTTQGSGEASASLTNAETLRRPAKRKDIFDLKDRNNPITHSTAIQRSEYITSVATGHEQSRGRGRTGFFHLKNDMLRKQTKPPEGEEKTKGPESILHGLRIYVNGYTRGTTRSEITRLVELHGGMNLRAGAGATHVITSMGLSASKAQKHLSAKKPKQHIVTPEWLYESIEAGKMLNEWKYRVLESEVQGQLTWSK